MQGIAVAWVVFRDMVMGYFMFLRAVTYCMIIFPHNVSHARFYIFTTVRSAVLICQWLSLNISCSVFL